MKMIKRHFFFGKGKKVNNNTHEPEFDKGGAEGKEKTKTASGKSNKAANNTTELVFIIDKSGSMQGFENDTIGGFNAMIDKQKNEDGAAYVTTVFFNNNSELIHDRVELAKVEPLTEKQYRVGGCTALLDTIGWTIEHIKRIHRYARPEDVPAKTIFLITTDGMENASQKYVSDGVKKMIKDCEAGGWEFIFVAANIDAVETAEKIGIRRERAANYCQDSEGTDRVYRAMSEAVLSYRRDDRISENWSDILSMDNKKRDSENKGS